MSVFFEKFLAALASLAPYLMLGFGIAGILHALVPREIFTRAMGGRGFWPVTRASLLGIPLPLCSCSVIPVAVELRRQGAGRGATAAFMVSTPETGVDSISSSIAVFHPLLVIFRPVAAMLTAVLTGLAIERFTEELAAPTPPSGGCRHHGHAHDTQREVQGPGRGALGGLRYAFDDLLGEITPYLIPALLLTAALGTFLHADTLTDVGLAPWLQRLLILLGGIPVYVCATSATPVAAGMIVAGVSPGAALVFLLAGPATNIVTISAVRKNLGGGAAVWYVGVVATISYAFGTLLDALWATTTLAEAPAAHLCTHDDLNWIHWTASAILGGLMLWHLGRRIRQKLASSGS